MKARLTELKIKSLKAKDNPFKISDGNGLELRVSTNGDKVFYFRNRINGKDATTKIGAWPYVTLKQAREIAANMKSEIVPIVTTTRTPTMILNDVFDEWIEANKAVWKKSYINSILQKYNRDFRETIGLTPIGELTPATILACLRFIESRGAYETAHKNLSLLGQVFRYGVASQYIPSDPTRDLKGALKKVPKGHFAAATTRDEAKVVIKAIRSYTGSLNVKLALDFLCLTFVRSGNVRHAKWSQIDFEKKVWNIPAEEMKMNRPHEVPLSRQALAILERAKIFKGISEDGYIFPALRSRKPLSDAAFTTALRIMGIPKEDMTAHGFRSMASSLLNEADFPPDVIEKQLAHVSADAIRGIYNRTQYWQRRVDLMQAWADMVDEMERE